MKKNMVDGTTNQTTTNLVAIFEHQVTKTPECIAASCQKNKLSYTQLNQRANQLSRYLSTLNIQAGDVVAVCINRDIHILTALLAILKTGATYLPIDKDYPTERIKYMLEDAGAKLIISETTSSQSLPTHLESVLLDNFEKPWQDCSKENPAPDTQTNDAAYIIYTSGSTGKPKGILQTHQTIANLVSWQSKQFQDQTHLNIAQFAAFGFDVSLQEIFYAILNGYTLHICPQEVRSQIDLLPSFVLENHIDVLFLPTSALDYFTYESLESNKHFHALKKIIVAGEALYITKTIKQFFTKHHHTKLENQYGPSETHVVSSYLLPEQPKNWPTHPSIGSAIDEITLYVLDEELRPVGPTKQGELCVAGAGLAKTYINLPAKTGACFVETMVHGLPVRLYRTGDTVEQLADGSLNFFGRADGQVKIRGYRIELAEIEAAILENENIGQCAVIAKTNNHKKFLTAYVTPRKNALALDLREIRKGLQNKLPNYMVPSAFIALETLPKNNNMKIDKKQLSMLTESSARKRLQPRNKGEDSLLSMVANILNLAPEKISININLFQLGFDSIDVAKLLSRIRTQHLVALSIKDIYSQPTIEQLSKLIFSRAKTGKISNAPCIPIANRNKLVPLSLNQERLWFLAKLDSSPSYNEHLAFKLQGDVDTAALQNAIDALLERHEVFRTVIIEKDGRPYQKITRNVTLSHHEITSLHGPSEQYVNELANKPFNINNSPLFRVTILKEGKEKYILLFCFHHLIIDGWSMEVICAELTNLYHTYKKGETSKLTAPPLQPIDFSLFEHTSEATKGHNKKLNYWTKKLKDFKATSLSNKTGQLSAPCESEIISLSKQKTQQIMRLARNQHTTLFNILLTSLIVLLHKYTKENDIAVGSVFSNRPTELLDNTIGFFLNTLVLRSSLVKNISIKQLLQQHHKLLLEANNNQTAAFSDIVRAINPSRSLGGNPLFNILIGLDSNEKTLFEKENIEAKLIRPKRTHAKFEISALFEITNKKLYGTIEYNASLFDKKFMMNFAKDFKKILSNFSDIYENKIRQINLNNPKKFTPIKTKIEPAKNIKAPTGALGKTHKELIKIWQNVHGNSEIKANDDFFNIGGHSLSAIDLIHKINKAFNVKLPLKTIFTAPTIEKQAIIIEAKKEKAITHDYLIKLNTTNQKKNIFLIHPVGGTIFQYAKLAIAKNIKHNIYAIQDPGIENPELSFSSFEEIASFYLELIRHQQPHGPYLLGGASFGGVMAIEIARQLEEKYQEKTDMIFMFDSWARYPKKIQSKKFFDKMISKQTETIKKQLAKLGVNDANKWVNLQWNRAQLIWHYQLPQNIPYNTVLFKAEKPPEHFEAIEHPDNYWSERIKQLRTINIPGNHETIFKEPNLQSLAANFSETLADH